MTTASSLLRFALAALAIGVAEVSSAYAQSAPPGAATSSRPTRDAGGDPRVEWVPAAPRQGSVVRIIVRPRAKAEEFGDLRTTDAQPGDTLPSVTVGLRARTDSLRTDSVRTDPVRMDSVRTDSVGTDLVRRVSPGTGRDSAARATADLRRADSLGRILDTLAFRPPADSAVARSDSLGALFTPNATLFGEPLHFTREPSGDYVALGAIPVDAPAMVPLEIRIRSAGCVSACLVDTVSTQMRIRRTAYKMEKMERLTVAPRFGQAPDSALAARIAREQALAAEVSRKSHETPRLWEGEFQRPRTARVTSAFGDGREFNGRVQSRHMGLDLAGAVGAPVVATNRGVVALVGDFYYAGNAVYIDHGAGLVTAYFHLSAVNVAQGDTVQPGMRIGLVGATGRVTGPHLHWVARYGAVTVDPSTLLEITAPAPTEKPGASPATDSSSAPVGTRKSPPAPSPPAPAGNPAPPPYPAAG